MLVETVNGKILGTYDVELHDLLAYVGLQKGGMNVFVKCD